MKRIFNASLRLASEIGRYRHIILMVLVTAMFVLAAAAPNATIGIGK